MAQVGRSAARWGGKVKLPYMNVCKGLRERVLVCRNHEEEGLVYFRKDLLLENKVLDLVDYLPERVLQQLHSNRFGNTSHFTTGDPIDTICKLGSLFAVKPCTVPYCHRAAVDTDVLSLEGLQTQTSAEDVFKDWPLLLTMLSGYTMWCIPGEVYKKAAYLTVRRGYESHPLWEAEYKHHCKERVVFDREMFVERCRREDGLLLEQAEEAADRVTEFKVAVELDLGYFGRPNCVFFLPPQDAKEPSKVVKEISNPELSSCVSTAIGDLDMSEMRLLSNPGFMNCDQTNWFKVLPKGVRWSWEITCKRDF